MGEFKRSPSKVWWASESVEWREVSESPGSQDSGFSDTETSPPLQSQNIPEAIFKERRSEEKPQNLSANFREKATPEKSIRAQLKAESPRRCKYAKNSPKVSRNLFRQKESVKDVADSRHQYAKDAAENTMRSSVSSETALGESRASASQRLSQSLPLVRDDDDDGHSPLLNRSAPAVLRACGDDEEAPFNGNHSLSSDCESELECLFNPLDSPKHTSTPKAASLDKMRHRRNHKLPLNLYMKYQLDRVPPINVDVAESDAAKKWLEEIRLLYEQECMTTLQSKSIAGELNQKVSHMAIYITTSIRNVLTQCRCIEREYKNLNSETKHVGPLVQSLVGNIMEFFKSFARSVDAEVLEQCDAVRAAKGEDAPRLLTRLFDSWQSASADVLHKEARALVDRLENPRSELDLRATVTGVTSVSLRNDELVDTFTRLDAIPVLLILCEKCEGSSLRALLLRALSTLCCSAAAVRQFEKFSGVQIVADTLEEASRPEPERSEAAALLAQVTAPWVEDNHCIRGLPEHSRALIASLTEFASSTRCCQNLLLCAAALANLSAMDADCVRHMLRVDTVGELLGAVERRGPRASVHLLEQVATLVANVSALEAARRRLVEARAPAALLRFLGAAGAAGDVEKRLQQRAIIALSRLCGEREAASQVVELGGVDRLVRMCREKGERFDSDAVLVATLATLRKIADACGSQVISAEDAQELVEPKLLDSFLAYSTQSESYV